MRIETLIGCILAVSLLVLVVHEKRNPVSVVDCLQTVNQSDKCAHAVLKAAETGELGPAIDQVFNEALKAG